MPYQRFDTDQKKTYQRKPSTGPTRAAINRSDQKGWLDLHTPYDPRFVSELKDKIQPSHRLWNPEQKVWRVNELFLDVAVQLCKKYYDEVVTDLLDEPAVPDNMFVPLFDVLKNLPNGNMDRIYRTLATALHPDHGGNEELMKKMNVAYQDCKK